MSTVMSPSTLSSLNSPRSIHSPRYTGSPQDQLSQQSHQSQINAVLKPKFDMATPKKQNVGFAKCKKLF